MKIISDAEYGVIRFALVLLVIITIVISCMYAKAKAKLNDMPQQYIPTQPVSAIDTVYLHDTIVDVRPITRIKYDTIYITQ